MSMYIHNYVCIKTERPRRSKAAITCQTKNRWPIKELCPIKQWTKDLSITAVLEWKLAKLICDIKSSEIITEVCNLITCMNILWNSIIVSNSYIHVMYVILQGPFYEKQHAYVHTNLMPKYVVTKKIVKLWVTW